ncbi:MAG: DNA replication and repair protein RecF [marine bacterium B5-7]|nr:MAG: DNA replication and repair protein RecF [marine bacterium B5-7]
MLYIEQLNACSIRNFGEFSIEPSQKLNFFYGPNASGKTSILESIYLLSRIKSFRSKRINDVISRGDRKLGVYAKGINQGSAFSVGVEKGHGITKIKFDGELIQTASEQAKRLPVYILTPDHHILFTGTPKDRRNWLDWSLFHVEQKYMVVWKDYHKALRHRNALLKSERRINPSEIMGWERLMGEEAVKIDSMRDRYISDLNKLLNEKHAPQVLSGTVKINYLNEHYKGQNLSDLLAIARNEDEKRGYTNLGPHRADISFNYEDYNVAKHLSRGQTKLFSAALVSTQVDKLKETGKAAIVLVDDLDAELDQDSSRKMLGLLLANNTQTFVSSLVRPEWADQKNEFNSMFHVKHGKIQKMLE